MTDSLRKIEVLEESGIKSDGLDLQFEDVVSIPADVADRWIALGWAKCAKTGECGERIPGSRIINEDGTLGAATKTIQPDDTVTSTATTKAE